MDRGTNLRTGLTGVGIHVNLKKLGLRLGAMAQERAKIGG
jgi:hypothetical protein